MVIDMVIARCISNNEKIQESIFMAKQEIVFGLHSVQAILKSAPQRVQKLVLMRGRQDERVQKIVSAAKNNDIAVEIADRKAMDNMGEDGNHQGVIAFVNPGKTYDEQDLYALLDELADTPLLLILDGVTDPHNLGACMRTADAVGVHAVIIPNDNSAGLNESARKVASGAADSVPLVVVTNLARTMKALQEKGLWISGAAGEAEQTVFEADLRGPRVIVMGAEGTGMRRLTRETCDELVKIPMAGTVSSLNVSVAAGVVLFEVIRQRASA